MKKCKHETHDPEKLCPFSKDGNCLYTAGWGRKPDKIDDLKECPIG